MRGRFSGSIASHRWQLPTKRTTERALEYRSTGEA